MMKCEDQVWKWKLWKGTLTTIGRYEKHQPNLRYTDSGSLMPRGVSRCRMGIAKQEYTELTISKVTSGRLKDRNYVIGDLAAIYCGAINLRKTQRRNSAEGATERCRKGKYGAKRRKAEKPKEIRKSTEGAPDGQKRSGASENHNSGGRIKTKEIICY